MSLHDLARSDYQTILENDGELITLTAPASLGGTVYPDVPCEFIRRGLTRDVEGMATVGDSASISLSVNGLFDIGITDPESLKAKGWTALYGTTLYKLDEAPVDYMNGRVTVLLKKAGV